MSGWWLVGEQKEAIYATVEVSVKYEKARGT